MSFKRDKKMSLRCVISHKAVNFILRIVECNFLIRASLSCYIIDLLALSDLLFSARGGDPSLWG